LIKTFLSKGLIAFLLTATLSACLERDSSTDETADSGGDVVGSGVPLLEGVAVEIGDEWRYQKGTSAASSDWATAGFDDTGWLEGNTGLGYGDGDDETTLTDMWGNYLTVYARKLLD
tara:strand:+ start:1497 stop:1847 length:351 start_codon:yes stop_codon:yes gene_type:complete